MQMRNFRQRLHAGADHEWGSLVSGVHVALARSVEVPMRNVRKDLPIFDHSSSALESGLESFVEATDRQRQASNPVVTFG